MSHSPLLAAHNLGLTLPTGRVVFSDLSLSVTPGLTGLTGPNGTGKSLLVQILAGSRPPTHGTLHRHVPVALLEQGGHQRSPSPGETVADRLGIGPRVAALARILGGGSAPEDYALVGDDGWDLPERALALLHAVGLGHLALNRPIRGLSGGELARVSLAGLILPDPELIILDEPTNDLDAESVSRLLEALSAWSGSVLAVSHNRELLRRADRILELTPVGIRSYGGNYDVYRDVREQEDAAARAELDSSEAARRKARRAAAEARERQDRRSARGARKRGDGSQPRVVMNAWKESSESTSGRLGRQRERALGDAEARLEEARSRVEERARANVQIPSSGLPSNRVVLRVEGVGWETPTGQSVLDAVTLEIRGPERVAVTGPNGSGKSTLVRIILGELDPTRGTATLGVPRDRVAYLGQDAALPPGETLIQSARAAHPASTEEDVRAQLARYLFRGDAVEAPISTLSGGERVRAALACALVGRTAPSLLILDEPTNHLDLDGIRVVEEAVRDFDGALLVISHDADFLEAVGVERRVELAGPPIPG